MGKLDLIANASLWSLVPRDSLALSDDEVKSQLKQRHHARGGHGLHVVRPHIHIHILDEAYESKISYDFHIVMSARF